MSFGDDPKGSGSLNASVDTHAINLSRERRRGNSSLWVMSSDLAVLSGRWQLDSQEVEPVCLVQDTD